MKKIIMILSLEFLLTGCGTARSSADEQLIRAIEQMEETNSTGVIYTQRRSHGLFGDLIDSTFNTVTGTK